MLSKNKKQLLLQLRQKKFRQKYNKFFVEGEKIALEVLKQEFYRVSDIICTETWRLNHIFLLQDQINKIITCDLKDIKEISLLTSPPEVIVILEIPKLETAPTYNTGQTPEIWPPVLLFLDGIQDPGNMGAILRIADWFGLGYVYCDDTCVDALNPKVLQSGMGAFLRVKTEELSLKQLTDRYPAMTVYGATMKGEHLYQADLLPGILVIGNEGNGISPENEMLLHRRISIPGFGQAESLNAAVATGILVSHFFQHNEP